MTTVIYTGESRNSSRSTYCPVDGSEADLAITGYAGGAIVVARGISNHQISAQRVAWFERGFTTDRPFLQRR